MDQNLSKFRLGTNSNLDQSSGPKNVINPY